MALSRQKISAALRKAGLAPTKWSKGRITWRASEGYDLRMTGTGHESAEISYNVRVGFHWTNENEEQEEGGLARIEAALNRAGISTLRVEKKVLVLDAI